MIEDGVSRGTVYRKRREVYMASWVESLLHFNAHMNVDGMAWQEFRVWLDDYVEIKQYKL